MNSDEVCLVFYQQNKKFQTAAHETFGMLLTSILRFLIRIIFSSPREYRIPPGCQVLVVEFGKNYVRYVKLRQPVYTDRKLAISAP